MEKGLSTKVAVIEEKIDDIRLRIESVEFSVKKISVNEERISDVKRRVENIENNNKWRDRQFIILILTIVAGLFVTNLHLYTIVGK